jgi:hypothetical protein
MLVGNGSDCTERIFNICAGRLTIFIAFWVALPATLMQLGPRAKTHQTLSIIQSAGYG